MIVKAGSGSRTGQFGSAPASLGPKGKACEGARLAAIRRLADSYCPPSSLHLILYRIGLFSNIQSVLRCKPASGRCCDVTCPLNRAGCAGGSGCESRCHIDVVGGRIILIFGFGRRDVADGLQHSTMVEPVDPLQRGIFDRFEAAPWSAPVDYLGLVKAIDRLGRSVVVAVAEAADRRLDPGFGEAFGILDGHVLRPRSL
jgi:hypothetical protein